MADRGKASNPIDKYERETARTANCGVHEMGINMRLRAIYSVAIAAAILNAAVGADKGFATPAAANLDVSFGPVVPAGQSVRDALVLLALNQPEHSAAMTLGWPIRISLE